MVKEHVDLHYRTVIMEIGMEQMVKLVRLVKLDINFLVLMVELDCWSLLEVVMEIEFGLLVIINIMVHLLSYFDIKLLDFDYILINYNPPKDLLAVVEV